MSDTKLKLIGAGIVAMMGLATAVAIILVGMFRGTETESIIALCGVSATPVISASLAFFMGHQNGLRNGAAKPPQ